MQNMNEIPKTSLLGRILIGEVVINIDPTNKERLKVRIPGLYDDLDNADLPWSLPMRMRVQGSSGSLNDTNIPAVGSDVYIQFDGGNKYSPFYTGVVRSGNDADALNPEQYGFTDLAGNSFIVDTTKKTTTFTDSSGNTISCSPTGIELNSKISITIQSDVDITVNAATATVTTTGALILTGAPVVIM